MTLLSTALAINIMCLYTPCFPTFKPPLASEFEYGTRSRRRLDLSSNRSPWPIVSTKIGSVQGYTMKTIGGREIYAFEGIPFAEPPIGNLRFKNPIPKRRSSGLINLGQRGKTPCIQLDPLKYFVLYGNEDCLYLNVYTPEVDQTLPLPVIVWFFGGAYSFGSKDDCGPAYLLDNDVILVTVNYRLGVFGFLTTGDKASPGNYGLKDQYVALEWVRNNIHSFGGSPDQITLMGQSSGGASVHLHMMSRLSRGKFVRGISLSGTAFCNWVVASNREAGGIQLSTFLGCPTSNSSDMVTCLRTIGPNRLATAQARLFEWLNYPAVNFGPTVEKYIDAGTFLTQTPADYYAKGDVAKVPWIAGFVRNEGNFYNSIILLVPLSQQVFNRKFDFLAPLTLDYRYRGLDDLKVSQKIRKFYFGDENLTYRNLDRQGEMYGDRWLLSGIHRGMMEHSRIAPTYGYVFNYYGQYSTLQGLAGMTREESGISHYDDNQYLFNSTSMEPLVSGSPDASFSELMVGLLTKFAQVGEPLQTVDSGKETRIWEPINPKNVKILSFSNDTKLIPFPQNFVKRIKFWEQLNIPY